MQSPLPEDFNGLLIALGGGPGRNAKLATEVKHSYWEIRRWFKSNFVPVEAWADLMRLAMARGLTGVNSEYLHTISQKGTEFRQRGKYPRKPKDRRQ